VPSSEEDVAFLPAHRLAALVRERHISSVELTEIYLARLRRYDPMLLFAVSILEGRAREEAQQADADLRAGRWRGPLHGVPYGIKDLFAVTGTRTAWGSADFQDQLIDLDSEIVVRLRDAGAVLVAKLASGEFAQGDRWFRGRTLNPWNLDEGASGSSAGPGSATAAGCVGFAIGTETQGSIVSPTRRNGISALRPTFGRVSRHGGMVLSWSMDKPGPMCRSVEDCAHVFNAIHGSDEKDPSTLTTPFRFERSPDLSAFAIGYTDTAPEPFLEALGALGARLRPMPELPSGSSNAIAVEGAAAFDFHVAPDGEPEPLPEGLDPAEQRRRTRFTRGRDITGVEYLQSQRRRYRIMQEMAEAMEGFDMFVSGSGDVGLTNTTGHPAVVVPYGFGIRNPDDDSPTRDAADHDDRRGAVCGRPDPERGARLPVRVILGKTNLPDFAGHGTRTESSVAGLTLNPYNVDMVPGGSSGGTATAVNASFAVLGLGTETGGSIQNPAGAQALVGVKTTYGLTPIDGIVPLSGTYVDVVGPLARTVRDAAIALDVLAGPTPEDLATYAAAGRMPVRGYEAALVPDAVRGKRFGLVGTGWRDSFLPLHPETEAVYREAVAVLERLGGTAVEDPFEGTGFKELYGQRAGVPSQSAYDMHNYFKRLGPGAPFDSVEEWEALTGRTLNRVRRDGELAPPATPSATEEGDAYQAWRQEIRMLFRKVMADNQLDALFFPQSGDTGRPVVEDPERPDYKPNNWAELPSNIINDIGLPVVTVPMGYFENGIPFVLALIGDTWTESELLAFAYTLEQETMTRRAPDLVPAP
jgi:Asp-tRNA(Asn)/Glu-tRNA(Gln) amidotransferase A subunit family amidase